MIGHPSSAYFTIASFTMTYNKSVVFSGVLHQYNWNIVESGVKRHNPNPITHYFDAVCFWWFLFLVFFVMVFVLAKTLCGLWPFVPHKLCKYKYIILKITNDQIRVITKLPNSKQSSEGKVKTHKYLNRQNQSTTGILWKP